MRTFRVLERQSRPGHRVHRLRACGELGERRERLCVDLPVAPLHPLISHPFLAVKMIPVIVDLELNRVFARIRFTLCVKDIL